MKIKKIRALVSRLGMVVLATSVFPQSEAIAGDGWGDNTAPDGTTIKQQTFYANSPTGLRDPLNCFDSAGNPASNCDTGTAIKKFKDPLPLMTLPGGPNGNGTGKYIPQAVASKWVNLQGVTTQDDYYEIAAVEYSEKFHSDLAKTTTLRGYVQIDPLATSTGGVSKSPNSLGVPLVNPNGTPILMPDGKQAYAYDKPHYMGPVILADRGTPTRLKFYNLLPVGRAANGQRNGDLFLPVDETLPGAGFGPDGKVKYTQNRVEVHLHGGDNPWISDGTPHQWITPAGESDVTNPASVAAESVAKNVDKTPYLRGAGAVNVSDMPDPGPGAMTYYFPNGESARMMFYHDHAFGLTRLNVYAGVAAGYMLSDPIEKAFVASGIIPADQIPLVIQDRTFVPKDINIQDSRWDSTYWGAEGDLWFPHVYETNQDPASIDGTKPVGRWDWGPYFWPVFPSYYDRLPTGEHASATQTVGGSPTNTGLSEVTTTPEAFMDTPVVNGQAYPTLTVDPKAYRFRILNAANDRFVNLGLYVAADAATTNINNPNDPTTQPVVCDGVQKRPDGSIPSLADCTEVKMVNFDTSYPKLYYPTTPAAPFGNPNFGFKFPDGTDAATAGLMGTGWGDPSAHLAITAGVPDPATAGPDIHLIANEGGVLANLVTVPSTPLNYEANKRSTTLLNVLEKGVFITPAGRVDAVIDFSQYAGKTLILYNDSPAPLPAGDPRIDYYTGMGDFSAVGGAENVKPGYGPNDRTIMQIHVKGPAEGATPAAALNVPLLAGALPALHGQTQPKPIVPQSRYAAAFSNDPVISTAKDTMARIYTGAIYLNKYNALTFTTPEAMTYTKAPVCSTQQTCLTQMQPGNTVKTTAVAGEIVNAYVENKAIQELFEPTYGRMNATLGVELPFTSSLTQTTIPLGFVDPATEKVADGETQFWKITHNGVDTHPVHFHLVNVQVINRVGWDGTIKNPTADEIGWKETVVMNPLEDIVVAVRAKAPSLPFGLPNSVRPRDPSQPVGANVIAGFTQVNPVTGNPAVVSNLVEDYGWEYVWHCHILGHEENDFMRPMVFDYWNGKSAKDANNLAVNRPDRIADLALNGKVLSWTDPTPPSVASTYGNPKNEIGFKVTRSGNDGLPPATFNAIANATSFTDNATLNAGTTYTYTVQAYNQMGVADASNAVVVPATLLPATNLTVGAVTATTVALSWANTNTAATTATVKVTNAAGVVVQTITPATSPLTVTGLSPLTAYTFTVTLSNASGVSLVATANATTLSNLPTVTLTAPLNNSVVARGTVINLSATATAPAGQTIRNVQFYDGATLRNTDTTAPYSFNLNNAALGVHTFTAKATDNANGATTSAPVKTTVANRCANEGNICQLPARATVTVLYGANTSWNTKTITTTNTNASRNIGCNNATFGDPLVGTAKACYYY